MTSTEKLHLVGIIFAGLCVAVVAWFASGALAII